MAGNVVPGTTVGFVGRDKGGIKSGEPGNMDPGLDIGPLLAGSRAAAASAGSGVGLYRWYSATPSGSAGFSPVSTVIMAPACAVPVVISSARISWDR